jgi:hypothetical protein
MTDEKFALLRTHCNNINRYRRLLKTKLTELERQFIERRLSEERSTMERLAASTFPLTFNSDEGPGRRPARTREWSRLVPTASQCGRN